MDSTCCHTDRNTQIMSCVWNRRVAGVRELVYFIILLCFTTARCSDTQTDRRTVFCSVQNCKHPGEYIWADIYIKKAHNIPREQPRLARLAFRIFALSYSDNKQSLNYIPWEYSASHSAASRVCRVWKDISWISVCSTFFFFFPFMAFQFTFRGGWEHRSRAACCSINRSQNLPEMDERWFGGSDTPRRLAAARHDALCLQLAANLR